MDLNIKAEEISAEFEASDEALDYEREAMKRIKSEYMREALADLDVSVQYGEIHLFSEAFEQGARYAAPVIDIIREAVIDGDAGGNKIDCDERRAWLGELIEQLIELNT